MKIKAIIEKNDEGYFQVYTTDPVPIIGTGMSEEEAKEDYFECFQEMLEFAIEEHGTRPEWADAEVEFVYDYNMKTIHRADASLFHEQNEVFMRLMETMERIKDSMTPQHPENLTISFESHMDTWTGLVFNQNDTKGLEVRLREEPREAIQYIRTWLKDLCDEENDACSTLIAGHDNEILLYYEDNLCAINTDTAVEKRLGAFVVLTRFKEEPVFSICCTRGELIRIMYEAVIEFLEEKEANTDSAKKWSKSLFGGHLSIEVYRSNPKSPVEAFQSTTIEETIY